MEDFVNPKLTFAVTKKAKNIANLSRTWKFVEAIQDDDTVVSEDISIHGFFFRKNYKKTGPIYLLKILINLWPDNWREKLGIANVKIILGKL